MGEIVDDVAMGPFGSNIKVDNFISEGVPVIRGANLHEGGFNKENFVFISEEKAASLKRSLAYPDDLVFTHRGTLGQVGIIPNDKFPKYLVSQSQMRLTVNKEYLIPKYLYYFFKSPLGQKELLKNLIFEQRTMHAFSTGLSGSETFSDLMNLIIVRLKK